MPPSHPDAALVVSTVPFDLTMRISADWLQLFEAINAGAGWA